MPSASTRPQLRPPEDYGIEFDYDLVRGLAAESVVALPTDRLEQMATAFAGPFLADLYLPRCSAYEAWRSHCANEAELLHLKALRTLVDRLAGEPERALVYLHALQSLLPEEDFGKEIAGINGRARLTAAIAPNVASRDALRAKATPAVVSHLAATAAATVPEAQAVESLFPPPRSARRSGSLPQETVPGLLMRSADPATIVRASHWMSHLEFDGKAQSGDIGWKPFPTGSR